jgi:NAD(P)-dependent dehydrogenase (short-subunit alcohol dehydrogenase family)
MTIEINLINLSGKKVFISGGNRGIGFEFAKTLLNVGADIAFCGRDEEQVLRSHKELEKFLEPNSTQKIFSHVTDIGNKYEVEKLKDLVRSELGAIDALICNAAVIGPIGSFFKNDLDSWESALNINLMGSIFLIHKFLPIMIENGGGKIIQISGGGATSPLPNLSSYAASKTAVIRFIETLALECKDLNIDINAVAPGVQKTRINEEMIEAGPELIGEALYAAAIAKSLSKVNLTQKACDLIKFLVSDQSNGITGKLISAEWDNWVEWPNHISELQDSKLYTLRRIVARDLGLTWGDI